MDIEKLKDARHTAGYTTVSKLTEMDWTELREISKELINTEIARQSVTSNIGETSDGYHTFNELYEHRTALFATLCNIRSDISWKSMKHYDGTMYDGMFIAGIETPEGQYTYHCGLEYLYMFAYTPEVDKAPAYDSHQPSDYPRLLGLSENSLYHLYGQSVTSEEVAEAIEYFEDTLQFIVGEPQEKDHRLAITALQEYQPWIPVGERLPESDVGHQNLVLALDSGGNYEIEMPSHIIRNVEDYTHWKTLPEPPKGK